MNAPSSTQPTKPFCLVAGLKLTQGSTYAFEEAGEIAARIPGCALHLIHVITESPSEAKTRELLGHLRIYVNEKARSLGGLSGITLGIHVRAGDPVTEIARFAREVAADLVILGATEHHRPSWYRTPTVERLVEATSCPVVVAGPKRSPSQAPVPLIEPPCPDCVSARGASNGRTWWCARHATHTAPAHTYSYQRELPLRSPDAEVIPTGIDL